MTRKLKELMDFFTSRMKATMRERREWNKFFELVDEDKVETFKSFEGIEFKDAYRFFQIVRNRPNDALNILYKSKNKRQFASNTSRGAQGLILGMFESVQKPVLSTDPDKDKKKKKGSGIIWPFTGTVSTGSIPSLTAIEDIDDEDEDIIEESNIKDILSTNFHVYEKDTDANKIFADILQKVDRVKGDIGDIEKASRSIGNQVKIIERISRGSKDKRIERVCDYISKNHEILKRSNENLKKISEIKK